MSGTEPNGWELKRSLDQLRSDLKDDNSDLKADMQGLGNKIDGLYRVFASVADHNALVGRVTTLEGKQEKRTDRTITIWLGVGTAIFGALVAIVLAVLTIVTSK